MYFVFRELNWVLMSQISSMSIQMEICPGRLFSFFVPEETVYSFNFLLDIFWIFIYLTCVPRFWYEDLVQDYLFTPQRESHSVYYTITFLFRLELSRIELPKLTPSVLMGNCDNYICPSWSIIFLYSPAHKACILKNLSLS